MFIEKSHNFIVILNAFHTAFYCSPLKPTTAMGAGAKRKSVVFLFYSRYSNWFLSNQLLTNGVLISNIRWWCLGTHFSGIEAPGALE
jgi:hypothetical protein